MANILRWGGDAIKHPELIIVLWWPLSIRQLDDYNLDS